MTRIELKPLNPNDVFDECFDYAVEYGDRSGVVALFKGDAWVKEFFAAISKVMTEDGFRKPILRQVNKINGDYQGE